MPPNFSRPHFTTHIRDPHFVTHISRLHLRLTSATPLVTHISDSNPRIHSRLTFATPDRAPNRNSLILSRFLLCDSTTDGRTVSTPQRHLPNVPTLTLTNIFWNLLPGLASTPSYYPPSCPPPLMTY